MNEKVAIEISCMVEWDEVISPRRNQELVDARTFYTVYWRELGKPFMQISRELCRHHASVMFLMKRHKVMMNYLYYKEKYEKFRRLVDAFQYSESVRDTANDGIREETRGGKEKVAE